MNHRTLALFLFVLCITPLAWQRARKERRRAISTLLRIGEPAVLDLAAIFNDTMLSYGSDEPEDRLQMHREFLDSLRVNPILFPWVARMAVAQADEQSLGWFGLKGREVVGTAYRPSVFARVRDLDALPYLRKALAVGNSDGREYAVHLLARYFCDPHVASTLLFLARTGGEPARRHAALEKLLLYLQHPEAIGMVREQMDDSSPEERIDAFCTAATSGRPEFIPDFVKRFSNKDDSVHWAALLALKFMPARSFEAPLLELIRQQTDPKELSAELSCMVFFRSEKNEQLVRSKIPLLIDQIPPKRRDGKDFDFDGAVRRVSEGLRILQDYGYPASRPFLTDLLANPHPRVRAAAAAALIRCGDPGARKILWEVFHFLKERPSKPEDRGGVFGVPRTIVTMLLVDVGEFSVIDELLEEGRGGTAFSFDIAQRAVGWKIKEPSLSRLLQTNREYFTEWWSKNRKDCARLVVQTSLSAVEDPKSLRVPWGWTFSMATIREWTEQNFQYDPLDSAEERNAALNAWRTWYQQNKDSLVWDPKTFRLVLQKK